MDELGHLRDTLYKNLWRKPLRVSCAPPRGNYN